MKVFQKKGWLINPWVDIVFVIGLPAVFIFFLVPTLKWQFLNRQFYGNGGFVKYLVIAHFLATFATVYFDKNVLAGKFITYLWIPLLISIAYSLTTIFGIAGVLNNSVIFYWIILHELFQYYFIVQICEVNQPGYLKIDMLINNAALLLGPIYYSFWSLSNIDYTEAAKQISIIYLNPGLLLLLMILAFSSMGIFLIRQLYVYLKYKRMFVFNVLMVLVTNLIFYIPLVFFRDSVRFVNISFRFQHAFQYLFWILFYLTIKFRGSIAKEAKLISYFTLPNKDFIFIGFFLVAAFVYFRIFDFAKDFYRNGTIYHLGYYNLAIFHLYIDTFFWLNFKKLRKLAISYQ